MTGFYMQYLESTYHHNLSKILSHRIRAKHPSILGVCRRRNWRDPVYECYRKPEGYFCLVIVNGREYKTDSPYESDILGLENAAMRAYMVCRNFSKNGGLLAKNGIVQGLEVD